MTEDEVQHAVDVANDLLERIVTEGEVPYMLLVPPNLMQALRYEYPHLIVFPMKYGEISCVTAEMCNFVDGEMVLH